MTNPRFIAFYLPQFHETPLNDRYHGPGFTEWTNLKASRKMFRGHQWPNEPSELGYYNLLSAETREAQARLAGEHGVEGFCYYHYWFGNGRRELHRPFEAVLESGRPDFPFCLCWANQSWHKKFWNPDGSSKQDLIVEQVYPGEADIVAHFEYCLPAFRDSRYIRVEGKPLFMIYRPLDYPGVRTFISRWQQLARQHGLPGIHFVGQTEKLAAHHDRMQALGLDGINSLRLFDYYKRVLGNPQRARMKLRWWLQRSPKVLPYARAARYFVRDADAAEGIYPSVIPNWDHTPRSGRAGMVLSDASPTLFRQHVRDAIRAVQGRPDEHQLIFIKSWNEWGEGNYMEPDRRFGRGYLEALARAIEDCREAGSLERAA